MEKKFSDTKAKVKEFFRDYAEKSGQFASISIVGSHAEIGKSMEKINDVDIVIVLKELTPKIHEDLIKKISEFCTKESTDNFGVITETRFGPFKMTSGKDVTFQLHCLIFDVEGLRDYAIKSPLVAFDWQRFDSFFGVKIEEISKILSLSSKDIISARGGIDYCLEQIRDGVNIAVRVQFDQDGKLDRVIEKFAQTTEQKAETCYKSPHNVLLNVWKLENNVNGKPSDEALDKFVVKKYGDNVRRKMEVLRHIYKDARSGVKIKEDELENCQAISSELLNKIKTSLSFSV